MNSFRGTSARKCFFRIIIYPAVTAVFVFAACSRSAPVIAFSTMTLNYIENDSGPVPTLNFFVIANDDDGYEDLAELRLYNDYDGLIWSFTPDNWIRYDESGNIWLGSNRIAMAGGEAFPGGQYRAVLIDKGGERTERTFGFEVPAVPLHQFPKLTVSEGEYKIDSDYPELYFLCYNADGSYRSSVKVEAKTGTIASLRLGSDILTISLWAHDSARSTSALTKMTPVR
ncbi:MAG: hypothetical protein LBB22_03230 [Treponema sp.]|jgi:hypothetical protein|nr:hypothetical protein [Treponema sp.]